MPRSDAASSPDGDAPFFGKGTLNDLLWQVTAYTHLMGEAALADTPLTVAASSMLIAVLEEPGMTVAEISRRIPQAQADVSVGGARLEKPGLIGRGLGPGPGFGLHVTDTGRE